VVLRPLSSSIVALARSAVVSVNGRMRGEGDRLDESVSMTEEGDLAPLDPISSRFASTGFSALDQAASEFVRSRWTPVRVADLLGRSRKQFTTAGADYDNFVSCVQTGFLAIEVLLHDQLDDRASANDGLNRLVDKALKDSIVTNEDAKYLKEFVLRFRNRIAHQGNLRLTPGMSQEILGGCHRFVASFSEAHFQG